MKTNFEWLNNLIMKFLQSALKIETLHKLNSILCKNFGVQFHFNWRYDSISAIMSPLFTMSCDN